jgi:hypothetical protein
MRPVMAPGPRQARTGEHAAHRPLPGLGEKPAGQSRERAEGRRGERRGEHGRQRHQRRRDRRGIRQHQNPSHRKKESDPARHFGRPSWTACRRHPTRRPGTTSPPGLSLTSPPGGPASASPRSATAGNTATSPRNCPVTASRRRSCGCTGRVTPATGPSASTGQHRPVHPDRARRRLRRRRGHPRTGHRRDLHPLRRPRIEC